MDTFVFYKEIQEALEATSLVSIAKVITVSVISMHIAYRLARYFAEITKSICRPV